MNPQTLSITLFSILFGVVIVWFVLIKLLFNRLERTHPQKYEAMGRPSLFIYPNNMATGFATLKFLVAREHKTLNDSYLSKLSDAMLVLLAIYLLLVGLFFVVGGQAQHPVA